MGVMLEDSSGGVRPGCVSCVNSICVWVGCDSCSTGIKENKIECQAMSNIFEINTPTEKNSYACLVSCGSS